MQCKPSKNIFQILNIEITISRLVSILFRFHAVSPHLLLILNDPEPQVHFFANAFQNKTCMSFDILLSQYIFLSFYTQLVYHISMHMFPQSNVWTFQIIYAYLRACLTLCSIFQTSVFSFNMHICHVSLDVHIDLPICISKSFSAICIFISLLHDYWYLSMYKHFPPLPDSYTSIAIFSLTLSRPRSLSLSIPLPPSRPRWLISWNRECTTCQWKMMNGRDCQCDELRMAWAL